MLFTTGENKSFSVLLKHVDITAFQMINYYYKLKKTHFDLTQRKTLLLKHLHHGWHNFYCSFPWINLHGPTVKGPINGVSYLNHSNPLFHVQLTPLLASFALAVNFPETIGSVWFKSYLKIEYIVS